MSSSPDSHLQPFVLEFVIDEPFQSNTAVMYSKHRQPTVQTAEEGGHKMRVVPSTQGQLLRSTSTSAQSPRIALPKNI